jgi:hypothetical protein
MAATFEDVSILALAVVIALVIVIAASMMIIIRFLRGVVGEEGSSADGCPAWFAARAKTGDP